MTLEVQLSHRMAGFTLEVGFTAPKGVTVLFGSSGAGKTTVVNAIAGLLQPDQGRIISSGVTLLDTKARVNLPTHRRRIGYVFQDARLFPHLSVRQNLLYGRWFNRTSVQDFDQIVTMLGIDALLSRRPAALSGGEKSRVALGRALLSQPRLLLLDEPLAALDAPRKAEILPYLERLRDETNIPILYITHAMAEVTRLATTLIHIEKGRVIAAGPLGEVMSTPQSAAGMGLREAGAVVQAVITRHEADGLTALKTAAGPLWLPSLPQPVGQSLRLKILAQDVMLSRTRPEAISALNILACHVESLHPVDETAVLVRLRLGQSEDWLLARLTQRSVKTLGIAPHQPLFAVIKAVAVASEA